MLAPHLIPCLCLRQNVSHRYAIVTDFVSLHVKEGSSAELECELSTVKDDNSVKWLKDGSEVMNKSRFAVDSEDFRLTIAEVTSDDEGVYDCSEYRESGAFVIKSQRRFKLSVQGWLCNSKLFICFKESGHVLCLLKIYFLLHCLLLIS